MRDGYRTSTFIFVFYYNLKLVKAQIDSSVITGERYNERLVKKLKNFVTKSRNINTGLSFLSTE